MCVAFVKCLGESNESDLSIGLFVVANNLLPNWNEKKIVMEKKAFYKNSFESQRPVTNPHVLTIRKKKELKL